MHIYSLLQNYLSKLLTIPKRCLLKKTEHKKKCHLENLSSSKNPSSTTPSKQLATRPSDFSIREGTRHRWRNNRVVEGSILGWLRVKNPASFIHRRNEWKFDARGGNNKLKKRGK